MPSQRNHRPPTSIAMDTKYGATAAATIVDPAADLEGSVLLSGNPCPSAILSQTAGIIRYDDASIDAYASVLLSAMSAANQEDYQTWIPMPAVHCPPVLEKVRSLLLGRMFPALGVEVYFLLEKGGDEMRLSVLAAVKRAVHFIIRNEKGVALFGALLDACDYCEERFDELQAIVEAVTASNNDSGFLACIMKEDHRRHRLTALKNLATAVLPHPQLCMSLIAWLLRERLLEHYNDVSSIMDYCFVSIAYDHYPIIIRFAVTNIDTMLSSEFGSRLLAECFKNARDDEYHCALEEIILSRTSEIAEGQYSHNFLRQVLKCATEPLKDAVAKRIAEDVVNLSADQFGTLVVEACILQTSPLSTAPLQRVLDAVLALRDDQLAELVQDGCSNDVVRMLLAAGKKFFPEQTMELAQRILKLPAAAVQRAMLRAAL